MAAEQNINPQDYELLSAYIDGELSDDERIMLEQRLTTDTFLQQELSSLRNTVSLIHQLPTMTAPHNFSLTAEMIQPTNVIQLQPRRRARVDYLSLVASVLLMVFGVMFMLSELSEMQVAPADSSVPLQSAPPTGNTAPEVANAPTEAIMMQSQVEEESADEQLLDGVMFNEAEESDGDNTLMTDDESGSDFMPQGLSAPPSDEARSDDEVSSDDRVEPAIVSDDADMTDLAVGAVIAEADAANGFSDTSGESSVESFGSEEAPADAVESTEILLYETTADSDTAQSEPAIMAGASFTEIETTGESTLFPESNNNNAARENPSTETTDDANGANDVGTDVVADEASGEETPAADQSLARNAVDEPPAPLEKQTESDGELTGIEIGIGLLGAGVLLLMASLWMIYRNRS